MSVNSQIRSALRGQRLVVVGGERREGALRRLRNSFEFSEVVHCTTRKSDASPRSFESALRTPGVVLVVWALGLSRTQHGESLHRLCRELHIPWADFYRIPHPNAFIARLMELRLESVLAGRRSFIEAALHRIGGAA